jgi:hypothetical protein
MSRPVFISYSGASKYKQCPRKYFLSKRWQDKRVSSAFPFGKAVEKGVDVLMDGGNLADAQQAFAANWELEHIKGTEYRQIFDNLDIQFYVSDFDKSLFTTEADYKKLDDWAAELVSPDKRWLEAFEEVSESFKSPKGISDSELAFYNRVIWECCRIRGNAMIEAFQLEILPKLDLTKKEHFAKQAEISMAGDKGDKISGYIDYIVYHKDHGWLILDLKTASYPYDRHAIETSEQLRTYVASIGDKIGSNRAGYAILLKKIKIDKSCNECGASREGMAKNCKACGRGQYTASKLRGETQLIFKEYSEEEIQDIMEDYTNVVAAVKNEVDFKNPTACTAFGRQCEFYEHCWGKKKLEELAHLEDKQGKS